MWVRFREMCEEQPAVRALSFLQTEVSSVVDHGSADEAALFRSLLTYLLNPTTRSRPITPGSGVRRQGHGHGQGHQHQEGSRKRSRSEEDWTNRLSGESDEDVDMNNTSSENSGGVTTLAIEEDPLERSLQTPPTSTPTSVLASTSIPESSPNPNDPYSTSGLVDSVPTPTSTDQPPAPSPIRFKQRVEVFEALLEFINENAKEPSGNLLDCINVVGGF
jgi:hypothetical protein